MRLLQLLPCGCIARIPRTSRKPPPIMPLIEEGLTRSVLGCFYASYNKLGYGFVENVCVGGLVIELQRRGHKVEREVPIAVHYDGIIVGTYRIDLVVDNTLLIEVKAEARLAAVHERQLRNYLCSTEYEVGLVLSYGEKPEFKRLVHTRDRKRFNAVQPLHPAEGRAPPF